jgi:hypothetical protein
MNKRISSSRITADLETGERSEQLMKIKNYGTTWLLVRAKKVQGTELNNFQTVRKLYINWC